MNTTRTLTRRLGATALAVPVLFGVVEEMDLDFDDDLFIDFENELPVEASAVEIVEEG